jgi:hypothetical protein
MFPCKEILLAGLFFLCSGKVFPQVQPDTLVTDTDSTTLFFKEGEKVLSPAKTMLLTRSGRTYSLKVFMESDRMQFGDHVLSDLDNDGKKELMISNYTGGAHCCDEIIIFKNIAPGKYQQVAKLFAGNTSITTDKYFVYNFSEQLGYFFTCFACNYTDTTDGAPVELRSITLKYYKGKMLIIPGDKELRSTINDNLGKLGEQPYQQLDDETIFDEGLRKEFAMNLAIYYFSFGKNLVETQKLFNKYYKFPDARKVWTKFVQQLQYMKKDNDF